jgi:hypothetical protein
MNHQELPQRLPFKSLKPFHALAIENPLGVS